jgi:predicted nucleotidyltransferase
MQRFGSEVIGMTLFGSRARGEGNEDSDVDVLIITCDESRKRRDGILDIANDILLEYEIDIAPMVVGEARYRTILDREWQIGKEIQRDGRTL